MTTQLTTQILIAERNLTGAPDIDAAVRLYATGPKTSLRERFAGAIRSSANGGLRLANRIDPHYQPA